MGTSFEKAREGDFGKVLTTVRQKAGLTQVDLARKLGWKDGSRVSRIENGVVTPDEAVWAKINKILAPHMPDTAGSKSKTSVKVVGFSPWKHDAERKILSNKAPGGMTLIVPMDETLNPGTFMGWVRMIHSQEWGSENERDLFVGGFVSAVFSLSK